MKENEKGFSAFPMICVLVQPASKLRRPGQQSELQPEVPKVCMSGDALQVWLLWGPLEGPPLLVRNGPQEAGSRQFNEQRSEEWMGDPRSESWLQKQYASNLSSCPPGNHGGKWPLSEGSCTWGTQSLHGTQVPVSGQRKMLGPKQKSYSTWCQTLLMAELGRARISIRIPHPQPTQGQHCLHLSVPIY